MKIGRSNVFPVPTVRTLNMFSTEVRDGINDAGYLWVISSLGVFRITTDFVLNGYVDGKDTTWFGKV